MEKTALDKLVRGWTNNICLLLIILYITGSFLPLLIRKGEPLQLDLPVWTAVTHVLRTEVLPQQKWFWGILIEREAAGYIAGELYSIPIILPWIISSFLPADMTIKLICLLTGLFLSLGFYYFASRFTKPLYSMLGALLMYVACFEIITDGMWYQPFSIALGLFFWIAFEKYLKQKSMGMWAFSVILLTLVFLSHPVGSLGVILIWGASLVFHMIDKKDANTKSALFKIISMLIISIMLAAPQLVNLFVISNYKKMPIHLYPFKWKAFVGLILNVDLINRWICLLIAMTAALGFFYLAKLNKRVFLATVTIFLVTSLLLSQLLNNLRAGSFFLSGIATFSQRFQYLSLVIFLFWFSMGFSVLEKIGKAKRLAGKSRFNSARMFLPIILITIFSFYLADCFIRIVRSGRQITLGSYRERWEIDQLFEWLNQNIDKEKSRVFLEPTKGTYKWKSDYPAGSPKNCRTHMIALSDIYTSLLHVGGYYYSSSKFAYLYQGDGGSLFGMRNVEEFSEEKLLNDMRLLNCYYIVANSPQVKNFLDDLDSLECLESIGRFKIYAKRNFEPAWAFFEDGTRDGIEIQKKSPTDYLIHVEGRRKKDLIISLAFNKRWKAYCGNRRIPLVSKFALISIPIDSENQMTIHLRYEIEKKIPIAIFCIGLASMVFFARSKLFLK
ncbi:MAG: hypothetical protein QHH14_11790 [Clostridiales bacterium]|nr:hypothetical protein [Clostridiales bacterium]